MLTRFTKTKNERDRAANQKQIVWHHVTMERNQTTQQWRNGGVCYLVTSGTRYLGILTLQFTKKNALNYSVLLRTHQDPSMLLKLTTRGMIGVHAFFSSVDHPRVKVSIANLTEKNILL